MNEANTLKPRAFAALRTVLDPELGLDIVELGLIYDVRASGDDHLDVDMTLTTIGCPVAESLPQEAQEALEAALPGVAISVQLVWDPPWTPDRLTNEAMVTLGFQKRSGSD